MLSRSLILVAFAGVATAFSPSVLPGVKPGAQFRSVRPISARAGSLHVRATAAIPMQQIETPRLAPWRQNLDLAGWASEVRLENHLFLRKLAYDRFLNFVPGARCRKGVSYGSGRGRRKAYEETVKCVYCNVHRRNLVVSEPPYTAHLVRALRIRLTTYS